jgi:hypothetical protein
VEDRTNDASITKRFIVEFIQTFIQRICESIVTFFTVSIHGKIFILRDLMQVTIQRGIKAKERHDEGWGVAQPLPKAQRDLRPILVRDGAFISAIPDVESD